MSIFNTNEDRAKESEGIETEVAEEKTTEETVEPATEVATETDEEQEKKNAERYEQEKENNAIASNDRVGKCA